MLAEDDLSRVARALGDATRLRMLALLLEGEALTAKELAYSSGVMPATATTHLARLRDDGLVTVTAQGRHKYFRLAAPEVARLVESALVLAPPTLRRQRPVPDPLRGARYCYDHLAGRLGTRLLDALVRKRLVRALPGAGAASVGYEVTARGRAWLATLAIDVAALGRTRRKLAYGCLDWSERRDHLAGALAAALAERMTALGWIARQPRSRAVTITATGRRALGRQLGLALDGP